MQTLTVFHDGQCPLCRMEVAALQKRDHHQRLRFADIHAADFATNYPHINRERADALLHGQLADGQMLYGLDVTVAAWQRVESHRWLAMTRWPGLRWITDNIYRGFARLRHPLGRACGKSGVCKY